MSYTEFEQRLWVSSVQLVQLNGNRVPAGIASGCLIDYFGKRILLTVSHATGNQKNWAIQLRYEPGRGAHVYQLGAMNFLEKFSLSTTKREDVDFSYVEVPAGTIAYRQTIEVPPPAGLVKSEVPITVHNPSLKDVPIPGDEFGFCGMVMPTSGIHFGQNYLGGEARIYAGLSFLRTEDDHHVFSLPFAHPGREHFQGCSGAPILSSGGSIVGLVSGGCKKTNEIFGVSVSAYKVAIDIPVGNIQ